MAMDETERLVLAHLTHRGFTDVVYEPDGNIPPDFLVDGSIAIEVRRLNQNYFEGPNAQGLEQVAIPLWRMVQNLINSMGAPIDGVSWFVYFHFSRPIAEWKSLEATIRSALIAFMRSPNTQRGTIAANTGFRLDVFRASNPHKTMFVMGGCTDEESGGWLLSEMETNIRHCASEKSRKVAKVRPKYNHWWLALVDHIGYGLDAFDRDTFRAQVSIEHGWDKIIIIDPRDHTRWFEI